MNTFSLILLLIVTATVVHEAVCCARPALPLIIPCGFCLGEESCNIFCCNCGGGTCLDTSHKCYQPSLIREYKHAFLMKSSIMADNGTAAGRFDYVDKNHDGFIDSVEAIAFATEEEFTLEKFFAIDDDGNGKISWKEFKKHS